MGILQAIGLGVLQGLTEFLPVSSSAHLALAQYFLGLQETPTFFDVMLHVGTLAAVLLFYGPRLLKSQERSDADEALSQKQILSVRMCWFLILATIPAGCAGVVFRPTKVPPGQSLESIDRSLTQKVGDLREHASRQPGTVLGFLTLTGIVLWAGSRAGGGTVDSGQMRWWHVVGIGLAQAVSAVCPGMSRSGMTVSTGMMLGLRPEWAVHFSLLMSIPAILGAAVLKSRDVDPQWLTVQNLTATAVGTFVAAAIGWICIRLLLSSVKRGRWWWFSIYIWSLVLVVGAVLTLNT